MPIKTIFALYKGKNKQKTHSSLLYKRTAENKAQNLNKNFYQQIEKVKKPFLTWKLDLLTIIALTELAIFIALFLLPILVPKKAYLSPRIAPAYQINSNITAENLINLTNKARKEKNLNILKPNKLLTQAAQNKAKYLLDNQSFAHTTPKNKTFYQWIEEIGYNYLYAGENLAMDFVTAQGLFNAWMASDSHQKNILNPNYEEIGVAVLPGEFEGHQTIMVVQLFGKSTK